MFNNFRFNSKDLCLCNSGKTYFKCCVKKQDRELKNEKQKSSQRNCRLFQIVYGSLFTMY